MAGPRVGPLLTVRSAAIDEGCPLPTLRATSRPLDASAVDVLVLTAATTDGIARVLAPADLPDEAIAHLDAQLAALASSTGADQATLLAAVPGVDAPLVAVAGLGELATEETATVLRSSIGAAVRSLTKGGRVIVALGADQDASDELLEAATLGALLGSYRQQGVRGTSKTPAEVGELTVWTPRAKQGPVKALLARAEAAATASAYARDLVNTPPNLLYPETFADKVRADAAGTKVSVKVLDEQDLIKGGYGGILAVGMGSEHKPRLVSMTYAPAKAKVHLALVGKGITFDSGGLDIKPANGMYEMKSDMAGAAAVAATVFAIAELGLPIKVTGWLGLAENMPSGSAYRASDVVTMRSSMTVEVSNTDAEGRMVLGDAIAAAGEQKPDAIIDIATLTGHQVIAFGHEIAAVMGNDDAFRALVLAAGAEDGEELWPMPLPKSYRKALDTECADIAHKGGREGGMLHAGLFLREFVPTAEDGTQLPWAHLDIAGPSFTSTPRGPFGKGGTGFGTGTLLGVAERLAERGSVR